MPNFPYSAPGIPIGSEWMDIEALERLAADLRRYGAAGAPTEAELAAAPVICTPRIIPDLSAFRLAGQVVGHPLVGPGLSMTSRIYALDRAGGWARSYSRLWRIGRDPGELQ
ncbi:DUF6634 family protein [Jiella mangrovi]|uniref:Uncharacterized protein n=1 Tax=Jiella mangrovi TaxID=2821407 RepID=A0ABS4BLM2_9HYPH|nr:DUF6634 family protein [Jiella mangrovi]MBP0617575.1 hypothetical protein [Jiella mangrovi]